MITKSQAYNEAEKVDKWINIILKKNPITKENAIHWLSFIRTIQTTLKILEKEVKILLDI